VSLVSGVDGACRPDASPPPKEQYGACPNAGEEAKEYHCVDYDASSTPLYVKGTYGMYGYF